MRVYVYPCFLIAGMVLGGCAQTQAERFRCSRDGDFAFKPSSSYAGQSVDQLEGAARGDAFTVTPPDLNAARVLGERHAVGNGVPKDLARAIYWLQQAAVVSPSVAGAYVPGDGTTPGYSVTLGAGAPSTAGDPLAMAYLGQIYLKGLGVKKDEAWGRTLLVCAAQYGVTEPAPPFPGA